jgi:hypothetical protein
VNLVERGKPVESSALQCIELKRRRVAQSQGRETVLQVRETGRSECHCVTQWIGIQNLSPLKKVLTSYVVRGATHPSVLHYDKLE